MNYIKKLITVTLFASVVGSTVYAMEEGDNTGEKDYFLTDFEDNNNVNTNNWKELINDADYALVEQILLGKIQANDPSVKELKEKLSTFTPHYIYDPTGDIFSVDGDSIKYKASKEKIEEIKQEWIKEVAIDEELFNKFVQEVSELLGKINVASQKIKYAQEDIDNYKIHCLGVYKRLKILFSYDSKQCPFLQQEVNQGKKEEMEDEWEVIDLSKPTTLQDGQKQQGPEGLVWNEEKQQFVKKASDDSQTKKLEKKPQQSWFTRYRKPIFAVLALGACCCGAYWYYKTQVR